MRGPSRGPSRRGGPLRSCWRWPAAAAALVAAAAHVPVTPEHLHEVPYVGVLFILLTAACAVLAGALLVADRPVVWRAARLVCGAAVVAYVESRTIGMPAMADDIGYWLDPWGVVSIVSETIVALLATAALLGQPPSRYPLRRVLLPVVATGTLALAGTPSALVPTLDAGGGHHHGGDSAGHDDEHAAHSADTAHDPIGHAGDQGLSLVADESEDHAPATACPAGARVRRYDVAAIDVDITLNRFGDHDPQGRAYVLASDLDRVRAEERRNAAARAGHGQPADSLGLQGDAIAPLTLRVHQGECLRIDLRNDLRNEPASLHLHGAPLRVVRTGKPAIATEPSATVAPGGTLEYEWAVANKEPEGTHYFHSHGNERAQTDHGLYGAVIVEPKGSRWLDPATGRAVQTGWAAMVAPRHGAAFREFVLYYAEIGDETYQPTGPDGQPLPLVDTLSGAYRPGTRALNYRSEPFYDRLLLEQQVTGRTDLSLAYSSYSFGDPATPMMRSYLGDPVKQRVLHAGSEVSHVHHVHGGSIRWRSQPGEGDTGLTLGLDKHPPLTPGPSERVDSQTISPAETFDVEDECGSGGCQQSPGDFLYHCHVTHHYFAGMWGIWRVYNTLQDGAHSTDDLPALRELPDRVGYERPAVTSAQLVGTTVDVGAGRLAVTAANLPALLARELPPAGRPHGYDAAVWDWQLVGSTARGEPADTRSWPDYAARSPGQRPPILFDPANGKPAYPMLRPHLGARPPFAPGHGPAPYLDANDGPDLPAPGANGPASVCPAGTEVRRYAVTALAAPVRLDKNSKIVDPDGEVFVLAAQAAAVRRDPSLAQPLTLRANAGQDCVDVTLTDALTDSAANHGFAKVGMHIHLVQFDVQGSDGVVAGFNYEQNVRPYADEGTPLTAEAPAGVDAVNVADAARFQPGELLGVGMADADGPEVARVAAVHGDQVVLSRPLRRTHGAGSVASTEFVRYRWYPDVQFGTAFIHDHVDALNSGKHGLYGALIVEPPGSTYHDPSSGAVAKSGEVVDVHTDKPVSADVDGSFRETVSVLQDDNPLTATGSASGGSLDLRAAPLDRRDGAGPAGVFRTAGNGAPDTPVVRAEVGDPVVFRTLVGASNEVHSFFVDGHRVRSELWSTTSPLVGAVPIGISERKDLVVPAAGGPGRRAGDYLYGDGMASKLQDGSWGILRVLDPARADGLQSLPGRPARPAATGSVCPTGAPRRAFDVAAVAVPLPMLGGDAGEVYVLAQDKADLLAGRRGPSPLVLHVDVGDCVVITLANDLTGAPVSFHPDLLVADPAHSGLAVGDEPDSSVAPGGRATYTFYAAPQVGEGVALVRDGGDVLHGPQRGLYGAIVVGARGARWLDPATGADISPQSRFDAVVQPARGPAYRDFTLLTEDTDEAIGTHQMPYRKVVTGTVGLNYQLAPLAARGLTSDPGAVYRGSAPPTPLLSAYAGDPVRIHVLAASSEQPQSFSVEGHRWPVEPGRRGTSLVSAQTLAGLQVSTLRLDGGAGGVEHLPGDYVYGDHRLPYREAGLWGIFRVHPAGTTVPGLRALGTTSGGADLLPWGLAGGGVLLLAGSTLVVVIRRRRAGSAGDDRGS